MELYARMNTLTSVKELALLKDEQWNALFATQTFSDALALLKDYRAELAGVDTQDVDTIISVLQNDLFLWGSDASQDTSAMDFFTLHGNLMNLKSLLIEKLDIQKKHEWDENHTLAKKELKKEYADELALLVKDYEKHGSWQRVYLKVNQLYYAKLLELAHEFHDQKLIDFVKTTIDIYNLSMYAQGEGNNVLPQYLRFAKGGSIQREYWISALDKGDVDFLKGSVYENLLENKRNFTALSDSLLLEKATGAKITAFGVLPFLAFMFASQMEHRNLRLLFALKQSGLEQAHAKERMRVLYEI